VAELFKGCTKAGTNSAYGPYQESYKVRGLDQQIQCRKVAYQSSGSSGRYSNTQMSLHAMCRQLSVLQLCPAHHCCSTCNVHAAFLASVWLQQLCCRLCRGSGRRGTSTPQSQALQTSPRWHAGMTCSARARR
jgi:hypothetical protein